MQVTAQLGEGSRPGRGDGVTGCGREPAQPHAQEDAGVRAAPRRGPGPTTRDFDLGQDRVGGLGDLSHGQPWARRFGSVASEQPWATATPWIDNELYTDPKTGMFFSDAKAGLAEITAAVKVLVPS